METQSTPLEKDPVCGMTVDPARAKATYEHAGKTYYFCCPGCKTKFEADPAKYLAPKPIQIAPASGSHARVMPAPAAATKLAASQPATSRNEYTCPMDPEIRQQGPGDCPKCGMALEPAIAAMPATKTEYTCPMHPEIVRDAPGNCPICGMALEPRTVSIAEEKNPELVRYDPAILDLPCPDVSSAAGRDVGFCAEDRNNSRDTYGGAATRPMVRIYFGDSCSAVGRFSVFCARVEIAAHAQFQHVHADRAGHRRRVRLQRGGSDVSPGYSRPHFEALAEKWTCILKQRRRSPRSSCSVR